MAKARHNSMTVEAESRSQLSINDRALSPGLEGAPFDSSKEKQVTLKEIE